MTDARKRKIGKEKTNEYASVEDFCSVFAEGRNELYGLSFQLTCDQDKAAQCFVAGREDCMKATRVFKEWARSWAKRTVIQKAIRELKPRPRIASSSSFTVPIYIGKWAGDVDTRLELDAVLALDVFERFVFVMSVLEGYSEHECSLLLGCTRRHVEEARTRACAQLSSAHRTLLSNEIQLEKVWQ